MAGAGDAGFGGLGERRRCLCGRRKRLAHVGASALGAGEQAMLPAQLGEDEAGAPVVAEAWSMVRCAWAGADGVVVRQTGKHDGDLAAGARAQQQRGGAGLSEFDSNRRVSQVRAPWMTTRSMRPAARSGCVPFS